MVQVDLGDEDIISEINLTPLVDVSLVLVIIFIVVAPFLTNVLKPLVLPSSSRAALSASFCRLAARRCPRAIFIMISMTFQMGAAADGPSKLARISRASRSITARCLPDSK